MSLLGYCLPYIFGCFVVTLLICIQAGFEFCIIHGTGRCRIKNANHREDNVGISHNILPFSNTGMGTGSIIWHMAKVNP